MAAIVSLLTAAACEQSRGTGPCFSIDRTENVRPLPPSTVRVPFRVLQCDGSPYRLLTKDEISILDTPSGEPFGAGLGEGKASDPSLPTDMRIITILSFDVSKQAVDSGFLTRAVSGAGIYLDLLLTPEDFKDRHQIGLYATSGEGTFLVVTQPTSDETALREGLDEIRNTHGSGDYDFVTAYRGAMTSLNAVGDGDGWSERFVVFFTAGKNGSTSDGERIELAELRRDAAAVVMAVAGPFGGFDRNENLTFFSGDEFIHPIAAPSQTEHAYFAIAGAVEKRVRSNYQVEVCTPVSIGAGGLRIVLNVEGEHPYRDAVYSTHGLNGNTTLCSRDPCASRQCGFSETPGIYCGDCPGKTQYCNERNACSDDCVLLSCGKSPRGLDCGSCDEGYECNPAHKCIRLLDWVDIPGGKFKMGCSPDDDSCDSSEFPVHEVTIPEFKLTATEITQEVFAEFTGHNPSNFNTCPNCPVERIYVIEARDFCEAVGGRLPTEAEWEYAARAGADGKYYCGSDAACMEEFAWYEADADHASHEVNSKNANHFGLYDMFGNVWEWVEDCWSYDYTNASADGGALVIDDCKMQVIRGGGWNYNEYLIRSSARLWYDAGGGASYIGFRCARDVYGK